MNEIICGDCLDVMRGMGDNEVDLILTDPPYGIGVNHNMGRRAGDKPSSYSPAVWDHKQLDDGYFSEMFRVSKNQIIFGANHFISKMPYDSCCWVVWDKCFSEDLSFAQVELAWTSFTTTSKKYTQSSADPTRIHPTQKPVKLFEWLLKNYAKEGDVIFDPFAGSAASLVACIRLGYQFIGVEKDPEYFRMAQDRINKVKPQQKLFSFVKEEATA